MNKRLLIYILIIASCPFIQACKKNRLNGAPEPKILSFAVESGATTELYPDQKKVVISIPDHVDLTQLKGYFQLSDQAIATVNGAVKKSGDVTDLSAPVTYELRSPAGGTSTWTVSTTPNTEQAGLGLKQISSRSNDALFDWFIAQDDTTTAGKYADMNGGPAVLAMALRWSNPVNTNISVDAIRHHVDEIRKVKSITGGKPISAGDPINVSDITQMLTQLEVPWQIVPLPNKAATTKTYHESLKTYLDLGYIAIVCVNLELIPYDPIPEHRIQRYFESVISRGHYVIIKGYKETENNNFWMEVYDPLTRNLYYRNGGGLKAKNRYYHSSSLQEATNDWWNYAVVVGAFRKTMPLFDSSVELKNIKDVEGY